MKRAQPKAMRVSLTPSIKQEKSYWHDGYLNSFNAIFVCPRPVWDALPGCSVSTVLPITRYRLPYTNCNLHWCCPQNYSQATKTANLHRPQEECLPDYHFELYPRPGWKLYTWTGNITLHSLCTREEPKCHKINDSLLRFENQLFENSVGCSSCYSKASKNGNTVRGAFCKCYGLLRNPVCKRIKRILILCSKISPRSLPS